MCLSLLNLFVKDDPHILHILSFSIKLLIIKNLVFDIEEFSKSDGLLLKLILFSNNSIESLEFGNIFYFYKNKI